jgi:hypothetical protein
MYEQENRLIAPDSETRIWKRADLFSPGEFVETTPLGGGIFPTIANVNHSCDPNFTIIYMGKRAVAISDRKIKAGNLLFHIDSELRSSIVLYLSVHTYLLESYKSVVFTYGAIYGRPLM